MQHSRERGSSQRNHHIECSRRKTTSMEYSVCRLTFSLPPMTVKALQSTPDIEYTVCLTLSSHPWFSKLCNQHNASNTLCALLHFALTLVLQLTLDTEYTVCPFTLCPHLCSAINTWHCIHCVSYTFFSPWILKHTTHRIYCAPFYTLPSPLFCNQHLTLYTLCALHFLFTLDSQTHNASNILCALLHFALTLVLQSTPDTECSVCLTLSSHPWLSKLCNQHHTLNALCLTLFCHPWLSKFCNQHHPSNTQCALLQFLFTLGRQSSAINTGIKNNICPLTLSSRPWSSKFYS